MTSSSSRTHRGHPLTVLVAPDSLKGSLSATDAGRALAQGFLAARPASTILQAPMSDGGEGLVEILEHALGGEIRTARVADPLGRPVSARFLVLPDGTAVLESAEAIGLMRLTPDELDPFAASSRGLGELIAAAAAETDVSSIILGVGGVATLDGGLGLREAMSALPIAIQVACDVRNPLLGARGAATVFGPQKGAGPEDVPRLEHRLASMRFAPEVAAAAGAGAAGGLGAMLLAMGATLTSGIELVMERVGLREQLRRADLMVTGEGSVDESSTEGKVVSGVCAAARAAQVPTVVFGGRVDPLTADLLRDSGVVAVLALSGDRGRAEVDCRVLGQVLAELTDLQAS
jgi:glycerate kinase